MNSMNFVFKPFSLQDLTLVKISADLWNSQHGLWTEMAESIITDYSSMPNARDMQLFVHNKWEKLENKVREKVSALPLPEACQKRVQHFLGPIGKEIYDWFKHHYEGKNDLLFRNNFPKQQCWTARGTIDYPKTVEFWIKNEDLCIKKRYQLACVNFLEEDIRELFQRIPEYHKRELIEGTYHAWGSVQLKLTMFWTWSLSGKQDVEMEQIFDGLSLYSCKQSSYYLTANKTTLAANEHFFGKLSQDRKFEVLVCGPKIFPQNNVNIIVSYLSQIDESYQERYFRIAVGDVLRLLLYWPWQPSFIEATKRLFRFLNQRSYNSVLDELVGKIKRCCNDYNYFQLFREFSSLSRSYFKGYLTFSRNLVQKIFDSKRNDLIKFIHNLANERQIRRLETRVFRGDCSVLEILLDEDIVSKEALIQCKTNFEFEYVNETERCQTLKERYKKCMRFVVLDCLVQLK